MKILQLLIILFVLLFPFVGSAQSILGDWAMEGTTPEGEATTTKISFLEDGKMTVDFGNDGTIDVQSTYQLNGNQVSFRDTSEESPCYNKVGTYEFQIEGDTLTARVVDDPCDERRGDGEPGTMTRME